MTQTPPLPSLPSHPSAADPIEAEGLELGYAGMISLLLGAPPLATEERLRLNTRETALGIALAGTSGAALLAYAFAGLPMTFTVSFVVVPATLALFAGMLLRERLYPSLHELADRALRGAFWGLVGTLAYDVSRPIIVQAFGFPFSPFAAIPAYGSFMTGEPATHLSSIVAGWVYHFWNGISFGMLFAIVRPRGGPLLGCLWGFGLQLLLTAMYTQIQLAVRWNTEGFMFTGFVGHAFWGSVLGAGLKGQFLWVSRVWGRRRDTDGTLT